jgi:segregation and condensation protein A
MSSSPSTPEPLDPSFRLELPTFQGPLDLLLHLIQKHELEILDLPIAFVTERYLSYIQLMERLDLDIASEYLVMAATLAHIKSKMLLPEPPKDQEAEDEEEGDPRAELIARLLEYQKYKLAAADLGSRGVAGRDVFLRGVGMEEASGPPPLANVSLFKLVEAFHLIAKRMQSELSMEISAERITIGERIEQILDALRGFERLSFQELFEGLASDYDLVVTFLAILEMAKGKQLRVYQAGPDSPIYVSARTEDDKDPVVQYDGRSIDEMSASAPSEDEEAPDEDEEDDDEEE